MDRPAQRQVLHLFAQVTEAVARATWALLNSDVQLGEAVVLDDQAIDDQVAEIEQALWEEVGTTRNDPAHLRRIVAMLLVLPELERSADLAEHIAQRAVSSLGGEMTPVSRGIVQRMSEVAIQMWRSVADAYVRTALQGLELHETDEELDILHDRLTTEVAHGGMQSSAAAQVTLVGRFYERLGDHAVNLSRRMASLEG